MSLPNHHPSAEMLLNYSAGTALPGHALCVATHIEFCSACRAAHQRYNAAGGKLLEELSETSVKPKLKEQVLALLDQERPDAAARKPVKPAPGVPRALSSLVPEGFEKLKWQMISASARSSFLMDDEQGAKINLLKLKPGGSVAHHNHLGDEYTVIVKGSFSDEDGLYGPGDFLLRTAREQHSPIATRDSECICLTVQEAPLQFTGRLFRLLNPFLRRQYASA
ncbi:anti-sigma factor [Proteobacteria bacterium 005FR1]|nr:anti-sigma factor [Proteobacteria bacterium 005FR1]